MPVTRLSSEWNTSDRKASAKREEKDRCNHRRSSNLLMLTWKTEKREETANSAWVAMDAHSVRPQFIFSSCKGKQCFTERATNMN